MKQLKYLKSSVTHKNNIAKSILSDFAERGMKRRLNGKYLVPPRASVRQDFFSSPIISVLFAFAPQTAQPYYWNHLLFPLMAPS